MGQCYHLKSFSVGLGLFQAELEKFDEVSLWQSIPCIKVELAD